MQRRTARRTLAALAAAAALTVAACSDDTPGATTPAPDTTAADGTAPASGQVPPVIVQVADVDGQTVEVAVGGAVDLVVDTDVTAWSGEVDDPSIATFAPGRDDGSATFNPGLTAVAPGETEVTMSDSVSDETVTFTLIVTES